MAMKKALYVTTNGNEAVTGEVVTAHRTFRAAVREAERARKAGESRLVQSARLMQLVQAGLDSTEATQFLARECVPFYAVYVEIGR